MTRRTPSGMATTGPEGLFGLGGVTGSWLAGTQLLSRKKKICQLLAGTSATSLKPPFEPEPPSCAQAAARFQACCHSPRVVKGSDCQRRQRTPSGPDLSVQATTCTAGAVSSLPRRVSRSTRPSQSMGRVCASVVTASRSAPHCASVACSVSTASARCWFCEVARDMLSRPRQLTSESSAITAIATSSSISVKPCRTRAPWRCRIVQYLPTTVEMRRMGESAWSRTCTSTRRKFGFSVGMVEVVTLKETPA